MYSTSWRAGNNRDWAGIPCCSEVRAGMQACSLTQHCVRERGLFIGYAGLRRASWTFYWPRHCQSRRVYDRQTFSNTWIFHILKADSVPKLCTSKGDGSWANLDCCLCNPKMNIDSAAGRLKDWQKVLHDRLDSFALYMSYLECDTARGVGDHLLKQDSLKSIQLTVQLPVHSGDGNYKNFRQ